MLVPRDFNDGMWASNDGARWAFFAIFIVIIIVVVLGTLRVNKKRSRQGLAPIYGTRWMTPPAYIQSQHQYNQPNSRDPEMPNTYVPTYTATANEFDMGYYDAQGKFHANPNAKASAPFQFHTDEDAVEYPSAVHQRTTSATEAAPASTIPDHDDDSLGDIARPAGPPPGRDAATTALPSAPAATDGAGEPPRSAGMSEGSSSSLPSFSEGENPPQVTEKPL